MYRFTLHLPLTTPSYYIYLDRCSVLEKDIVFTKETFNFQQNMLKIVKHWFYSSCFWTGDISVYIHWVFDSAAMY